MKIILMTACHVVPLFLTVMSIHADQRKVVDLEIDAFTLGDVPPVASERSLPLRQPTSLKNPRGTEIWVEEKKLKESTSVVRSIVIDKPANSEEVSIAFQWPKGSPVRTNFQADINLFLEKISKGGSLSIVFKALNGDRVIPRLQISNGGAVSLVQSQDKVYRMGGLPMEEFFLLSIRVNYAERTVQVFANNKPLGDEVPFESVENITDLSISCSDVGSPRRVTIGGIEVEENY